MKILEIDRKSAPYSFDMEVDGHTSDRTPESRDCVSVSTIKHYTAEKLGLSNYSVDFNSEDIRMKSWLGLAFEDRLAKDLARTEPDHIPHPGEIRTKSGRVMAHPDGYYFASGGLVSGEFGVDEMKHTYTSSLNYSVPSRILEKRQGLVWDYLFQLESYIAILRSLGYDVREGRLWTMCPMGDWKEDRGPVLHATRVEFTEKELDRQLVLLENTAQAAYDWKYNKEK